MVEAMTGTATAALCPRCGKDMATAGVAPTVVGSGGTNVVLLTCGACSTVFAALPGPLIPRSGER
jgi:hypothetical protein